MRTEDWKVKTISWPDCDYKSSQCRWWDLLSGGWRKVGQTWLSLSFSSLWATSGATTSNNSNLLSSPLLSPAAVPDSQTATQRKLGFKFWFKHRAEDDAKMTDNQSNHGWDNETCRAPDNGCAGLQVWAWQSAGLQVCRSGLQQSLSRQQ